MTGPESTPDVTDVTSNAMTSDVIYVFWTGGWDSTYRIIELSRSPVTVQPIYVAGDGRKSETLELEAMGTILASLEKKEGTRATFLPLKIIKRSEIPPNEEISKVFRFVQESGFPLGSQYEWLAWLATSYPGVEVMISLRDESCPLQLIERFGELTLQKGEWRLDPEKTTRELFLLFGNFSFPTAAITGLEMKKNILEWGYEDVMKHIWFCHKPFHGEPCGVCHPCQIKMIQKMGFLLPKSAIRRYRQLRLAKALFGSYGERAYQKLIRKFS